ncbi:hypothetical protein [Flavobacterium lindanitolerans]|uniref:hypothetical protein n=1 Tax=Flavobacterium lindanitolerans TaxID=428988 RepID=UPI0031DA425C
MGIIRNQGNGLTFNVGDEIHNNSIIYTNVNQEIIVTTEDKIKLVLIKTRETLKTQRDWITPVGLFISFVTTLCTSEFMDAFNQDKHFWKAIFVILAIISFIWLCHALWKMYKHWGCDDLDKIIKQIKLIDESPPKNESVTEP